MTPPGPRGGRMISPAHPASVSATQRGILLMMAVASLFPLADAIAKYIVNDFHVVEIVWGRLLFQTLFVALATFLTQPVSVLRTSRFPLQAWRAIAGWLSNFPFIVALAYIGLADTFAIVLVGPLLVTALSVPLLGERVGPRRWAAVVIGFAGALVIIRPGMGLVHWAASLPLISALVFAFYQIATRSLGATDRAVTTMFYNCVVPLVINSALVPFFWTPPTTVQWALLAAMGLLSGVSHFLLIKAFTLAPASTLAPFVYVQMVSGIALGYAVFGDFPDVWTLVGAAIIVASGLYMFYRERLRRGADEARRSAG